MMIKRVTLKDIYDSLLTRQIEYQEDWVMSCEITHEHLDAESLKQMLVLTYAKKYKNFAITHVCSIQPIIMKIYCYAGK